MAKIRVLLAFVLIGGVLTGCAPEGAPAALAEGVTITPLGQGGRMVALAELTGAYLVTAETSSFETPGECVDTSSGTVCPPLVPTSGTKVMYSPGGKAPLVQLFTSDDYRDEAFTDIAISPDGATAAVVVDTCQVDCRSTRVAGRTATIHVIDTGTLQVVSTKAFRYESYSPGGLYAPVNDLKMAGGTIAWTSGFQGAYWRPESGEFVTFSFADTEDHWIQQVCADGKSALVAGMENYPGSTKLVLLPTSSGATVDISGPEGRLADVDKNKFTTDCSSGWHWWGNYVWGGDFLEIDVFESGLKYSLDLNAQFGVEIETAVMSDDLLTGIAILERAEDDRWEFWRFTADGSAPPVLIGWSKSDQLRWFAGGSSPGGIGYVTNDGTFALTAVGPGDEPVVVSAEGLGGGCRPAAATSEVPLLTRSTDFVVSLTSPISLTTTAPAGDGCRTSVRLSLSRLSPNPAKTSKLDMKKNDGFLFEKVPLPHSVPFTVGSGGGSGTTTISPGDLAPGLYDIVAVRSRADGSSPIRSEPVRVKIVSPALELLDRTAKAKMRAAGGNWATIAKDNRQFTDFVAAGTSSEVTEVLGDLDTASAVAVQIPGFGERAADRYQVSGATVKAAQGAWNSERIWAESAKRGSVDPTMKYGTAVVAWLGYDAPFQEVASDNTAIQGADLLAADLNALGLGSNRTKHLTLVGHSYGSLVASLSIMRSGVSPTDLVVVGSPGLDIDQADYCEAGGRCSVRFFRDFVGCTDCGPYDYGVEALKGVRPGHVWAGAASEDPIPGDLASAFGVAPHLDEFGANEFHTDARNGHAASTGHSEYFQVGSTSLHNIVSVVQGDYVAVLVRDYSPFS